MASVGICLFVAVICIITGSAKTSFVKVECKTEKVGHYGQQSLLECVVRTRDDSEIRVVTWKKEGVEKAVLVFNDGKTEHERTYSFAVPSWNVKNMNVSLLITNTAVEHEGDYTCMVLTDRGDDTSSIRLNVTAKYNKPIIHSNPEKITINQDAGVLMCESYGGYPKGELRWFVERDTDCTDEAQMEVKPTESGLFHLSSKLPLLGKSQYTCVVFNASGDKEEENTFVVAPKTEEQGQDPEKGLDSASKIVAPLVVIGSVIAGLLLALLFYRRRSQRHHHGVPTHEYNAEEGDDQEMDETRRDSLA